MIFDYSSYIKILELIQTNDYHFGQYGEDFLGNEVLLRHDIDLSLEKACDLANIEQEYDEKICSTYFLMISSDSYNVFSYKSMKMIDSILNRGMRIGLHFDETKYYKNEDWTEKEITEKILYEKELLERMIDVEITAVSMHRPSKKMLDANLMIPGLINTYSDEYFRKWKYLSDSYHRWREDVEVVIESKYYSKIQILIHPFWYYKVAKTRNDVINLYINEARQFRYKIIEDSILPPGMTLEESINNDDSGNVL